MAFNRTQQVALAVIPKFSAFVSILGSLSIIHEILVLDRRKLGRVYHRLLLMMSIYDVMESSFNFQSSWPIPEGTPGVAFAIGNTAWCEAQGFILQFGLAIPILNMCLAIYYLLVIKYSWTEQKIALKAEPWFHTVSLGAALTTSALGIHYDLFNNSNLWCWYAPFPPDCKDSFRYGDEGNCIRGDNAWIYRWGAYYAPLWFCILAVMVLMLTVYKTVQDLEHASSRYLRNSVSATNSMHPAVVTGQQTQQPENNRDEVDSNRSFANIEENPCPEPEQEDSRGNDQEPRWKQVICSPYRSYARRCQQRQAELERNKILAPNNSKSKQVAMQALCYVGAFYWTFLFATINRLVQQIQGETYFPLVLIHSLVEPGQGFLNYLVYLRPRYLKVCERYSDETWYQKLRLSVIPNGEEIARRQRPNYISEDQRDEEECRMELARWRRALARIRNTRSCSR